MINKVIYIEYRPLTEKVIEDFYFQNLVDKGISIEYWDITDIYFPNIFKDSLTRDFIVKINSLDKLEECLKQQNIENTLFLPKTPFAYRVLTLYKMLSKYKCKTGFLARGSLPQFPRNFKYIMEWLLLKLRKPLNLFFVFKEKIERKYAFLLKKTNVISPYDIVFRESKFGMQAIGLGYHIEEKKSKIIDINSFDFDKYIETKNCTNIVGNKYCVYLDEYLTDHSDVKMYNLETVEPTKYYYSLNNFFEFVEKKFGVEVVIAAHPKAEKYKEKNFFNGRKVFFNKTANLVRHSEFTLTHCSTSISFAVLNNKPVLFLVSNAMKNIMHHYYNFIVGFSKTLESDMVNIDEDLDDNIVIKKPVDSKYSEYKYNYLTSKESEMKVSSEVFTETILNL